jgi:hypothetical protein
LAPGSCGDDSMIQGEKMLGLEVLRSMVGG